jgi:hypothetical protein
VREKVRSYHVGLPDDADDEDGFLPFTTTLKEMVRRAKEDNVYFCVHLVSPNQICEGAKVTEVTDDGFKISFGYDELITWDNVRGCDYVLR